mmetsp:Transcript_33963/g.78568  ORF Transcript_33963/g.78568 Transcript_33963/m.78568 type:complete len:250 (-) Transcript_33963:402-1151(-)
MVLLLQQFIMRHVPLGIISSLSRLHCRCSCCRFHDHCQCALHGPAPHPLPVFVGFCLLYHRLLGRGPSKILPELLLLLGRATRLTYVTVSPPLLLGESLVPVHSRLVQISRRRTLVLLATFLEDLHCHFPTRYDITVSCRIILPKDHLARCFFEELALLAQFPCDAIVRCLQSREVRHRPQYLHDSFPPLVWGVFVILASLRTSFIFWLRKHCRIVADTVQEVEPSHSTMRLRRIHLWATATQLEGPYH